MNGDVFIKLESIPSAGPSMDPEGPASPPCPVCSTAMAEDQEIVKHDRAWMHAACFRDQVTAADVAGAWLLIAGQIAQRPHKYCAAEIRAVIENLIRLARRDGAP